MFRFKYLNYFVVLGFLCAFPAAKAQLAAGDIAVVAFGSDNPDGFSFVVLNPDGIAAGQTIFFSDDGYNGGSLSLMIIKMSFCTRLYNH